MERYPLAKAINLALRDAMRADERVLLAGEDIGALGGVFRVTDGLLDEFGPERVRDTPLAESGIVGTAIGMAMGGYRPVVEIQFEGFVFPAFNQITTQLAKLHYRSQGDIRLPIVIRIPSGGGIGAIEHHGESPESYFAHTPGLRVVTPAGAADAYELLRAAIACDDPVIYFEPKSKYWTKEEVTFSAPSDPVTTLQTARVERHGHDVTLAGYGPTVATLHQVAATWEEDGVSCDVINLRSLNPLDLDTVADRVTATGRLVIAHEAPTTFGPGAELAAAIQQQCFYRLEAPIARVGGAFTPYPPAALEAHYLPSAARIDAAIIDVLDY
ncbi:MAG: alpha-ketoacid dehydrogenase subunit beta [Bowdeniella nasicola]|nr:alpha-ketoacid dehydrogenase subunit beta [Bowdeniella nasicola]